MNQLTKLLRSLRITDDDGSLSLTSLMLLVAMYKITVATTTSMEEVGLFLTACATYQGKKVIRSRAAASDQAETLATLGQAVQALEAKSQDHTNKLAVVENRTNSLVSRMK